MDNAIRYITIGTDCAPAAALRNLSLREFALPFDWVQMQPDQLCRILYNNFKGYHENLTLCGSRIQNGYGVYFPHDFPTIERTEIYINEEADVGGIPEKTIAPGWERHIPAVQEKYARRIERFHSILSSNAPIIALYRGSINHIPMIKEAFSQRYNKQNIVYVVATKELSSDAAVIACDTEAKGVWNDLTIWDDAISLAKEIALTI